MRVLVTGGAGFIGTNFVEHLLQRGDAVCSIDIAAPKNNSHRNVYKRVDLLDRPALTEVLADFKPTEVVHLGARTDMEQRKGLEHFAANIAGVENLIEAIKAVGGVRRTIFASSRLVFDLGYVPRYETDYHASTLYGQSKTKGEELVRAAPEAIGTWTIVRPTGIWGPWFGEPYLSFFSLIKKGLYVNPGRKVVRKSYGYVGNFVHQLQRLLEVEESSVDRKTFLLADYQPVVVADWANQIATHFGSRPVKTVPASALRAAAAVGDGLGKFGKRFPMTSFRFNNMVTDMVYDTADTETVVGPLPFTLEVATAQTIEWMRQHGH
ncbi:NAD-dependent epimerase/dehydratase family protein [Mycobacterium sp. SA01]|uniref:NAD-dependent epimerase/dehydratase family protein n=1 Tax=Mycobacterium sp. SA01 TaxID=3238820 RepID=UPI00351BA2D1